MGQINYNEIPDNDSDLQISPEECKAWANKIRANKQHAFWGGHFGNNVTLEESSRAVKFVNMMDKGWASKKGANLSGWITAHEQEREQALKANYGTADLTGEDRKTAFGERAPEAVDSTSHGIGYGTKDVKASYGHRIEDGGGEK